MYDNHPARARTARPNGLYAAFVAALLLQSGMTGASVAEGQALPSESVIRKIGSLSEKMELTTNTSRILTLDKNIPRVQVNNPELLAVTPLSANQIQISAKKAGVTQVNLWDEDGNIHTVDVLIYGDARELEVALQTQFPNSTIRVYRYSESLVLKGFVDRPDNVSQIMRLAEDYAPKVINNITVGGVQQVLLKVRVMEISRTKLRQLGMDWAWFAPDGFAVQRVNGLIDAFSSGTRSIETLGDTFSWGIIGDNSAFFGVLDALQNAQVAKILAEPNLVTISGRPAQFNVGGEVPILVPQSLGTTSIEYKPFGTQVDFLPIVLGNGNIRLEVRPRISFLDPTSGIVLNDILVPGFNVRQVDTGVEMRAGQTLALAGLVQERTETRNRGLPYLSDMPILGVPFRRTRDEVNEIELLIIVTPEFVDAMEPCQVACGGPGYFTTSPDNCGLYCGGHVEVPAYCNPIRGMTACGECSGCQGGGACDCGGGYAPGSVISDGMNMPGGVGYEGGSWGPATVTDQNGNELPTPAMPEEMSLPGGVEAAPDGGSGARYSPRKGSLMVSGPSAAKVGPEYTTPRPYSPPRQPVYVRNVADRNNPQSSGGQPTASGGETGLIGPVGYDVE